MSTLFRFYKYFTNDFYTKYLLVNNFHLGDILAKNWLLLSPVKPLNPNKFAKFSDFLKNNQLVCLSNIQVTHNQLISNYVMSF